jgi:hypothetical protein
LGNGDGTFQAPRNYGAAGAVAVGDFNGDGTPDLAVTGGGGVRVLLGNGDGTCQTTNFSYVAGNSPTAVAVGDFNGDGLPDLAVANFFTNDVSILLNDGVWNGPAPRPGSAPHLTFAPLPSALPSQQLPEAWWSATPDAVALPTNPMPHQPILDLLAPAPNRPETAALPPAVPWSREAWDAFLIAELFEFGTSDIARWRAGAPIAALVGCTNRTARPG